MAKVGVVLAGCGVKDGSEIHEAVFTLYSLAKAGVETVIAAPDMDLDEIDHVAGEPTGNSSNVLIESARIARGEIRPLSGLAPNEIDALILPGGFGAAKHLCDFALKGASAEPHGEIASLIKSLHAAGKPIGAMCIAPVILAAVFRDEDITPELTIGNCPDTAATIEAMDAVHVDCAVDEIVIDTKHKLVTTPAYMLAGTIAELPTGIDKLVAAVLRLAEV
ncbi:MAG: isoprenoid biosynthesis glyoxalase ElbB [bacterium]|nr:isoprenoid biosynthesis glyoxalase ElbB [bacterium]